jgi:nucleotide-binding universal stress UspA family protein
MKRIGRVLHASDFSAASRRAFATAVTLARSLDAKLTIVHVMAPVLVNVPEQYIDAVNVDQLDKQARQWSARHLNMLAGRAKKAGVDVTTLLREGDPVEHIVRAGRSTRADLIVVGTHGRRGLQKLFLGSVAERLVTLAPCPVVIASGQSRRR